MKKKPSNRPLNLKEASKRFGQQKQTRLPPPAVIPPRKTIPVRILSLDDVASISTRPIPPFIPDGVSVSAIPHVTQESHPVAPAIRKGINPGVVFWGESRRTFQDRNYPWRAIGRIDTPLGFGTAYLVGPRHIATASHVIEYTETGAGFIRFRPGFNRDMADGTRGEALEDVFAEEVTIFRRLNGRQPIPFEDVSADMAICVLERRVGDSLGWLGSRVYDDDWDDESHWSNVGYPGCPKKHPDPCVSDGNRPFFDFDAPFKSLNEKDLGLGTIIRCEGDITEGHSGGPVFGFWNDGPYSIGIYSGSGTIPDVDEDQGNFLAGGELMVKLVKQVRQDRP